MHDFKFAVRSLLRTRGSTTIIVLILALGIGMNSAVFSLYNTVLLRALPYANSETLVNIKHSAPGANILNAPFSVRDITDYRDGVASLDAVEEFHSMQFALLGLESPERVQTGVVSANFFDTLGVTPLYGRTFKTGEDDYDADALILMSHQFWTEKAGADPGIVGRVLTMNNKSHEVIGVLPPITQFPNANDVYITVAHCPTRSNPNFYDNRQSRMMIMIGKLKPGASIEQLNVELDTVAKRLMNEYPQDYPQDAGYTAHASFVKEEIAGPFRKTGHLLLAVAALVLFAAIANVTNISLARLSRRADELAIRSTLGASRGRIMRQLLVEHLVLGVAGGVVGVAVALLGSSMLAQYAGQFSPRVAEMSLDWQVLAFGVVLAMVTGVLIGLIPAWRSRLFSNPARKGATRSVTETRASRHLRSSLIVVQISLTMVILTATGLMLRSMHALNNAQPGFFTETVVSARLYLNPAVYTSQQSIMGFYDQLVNRLEERSDVHSAAVALTMPLQNSSGAMQVNISYSDRPDIDTTAYPRADYRMATNNYFETLGIASLEGRMFTVRDDGNSIPVAVINQSMAQRYWPGESAVGKRFTSPMNMSVFPGNLELEVIGVVANVSYYGVRNGPEGDAFYTPMQQGAFTTGRLIVRTASTIGAIKTAIRQTIRDIDPNQPVDLLLSLEEVRQLNVSPTRLLTTLLGLFAALALVISAAGVSGLIAFSVNQRTREFGIRLALGADQKDLVKMVLKFGAALALGGIVLGSLGSVFVGNGLEQFLFGVNNRDLPTFVVVVVVLVGITFLASLLPARRIGLIHPAESLRQE